MLARIKRFFAKKEKRTVYAGAQNSRFTADWIFAPIQSANQDIKSDHRALVARAREMQRDDPLARRFLGLVVQNVVGADGIRLQARVKKSDDNFDNNINDPIEAAWCEWGQPENCTADGRLSWVDVEQRAVEEWARDGEALIRMLPGFNNKFGFALQILDTDQLDVTFNRPASAGVNEIVMGIELNSWGRPVTYHFWSGHPNEAQRDRKRIPVPAEQVIHLYKQERAGQARGVTKFAGVMMRARMLAGYAEAELVAARTAASKMGFFTSKDDLGGSVDPNTQGSIMEAEPGTFERLPHNVQFQAWDPQHPTSAYDAFTKACIREIAAGLEVSYASLSGDVSEVNYSSIRAGLLVERDVWKSHQKWLIAHLHRRVYLEWFKYALLSGALKLPQRYTDKWKEHVWLPRGWAWVDPMKDIQAAGFAIGMGIDSRQRIAAEHGRDFEEVLADLDRENQLAEEYEVSIASNVMPQKFAKEGEGEDVEEENGTGDAVPNGADRARLRLARRL